MVIEQRRKNKRDLKSLCEPYGAAALCLVPVMETHPGLAQSIWWPGIARLKIVKEKAPSGPTGLGALQTGQENVWNLEMLTPGSKSVYIYISQGGLVILLSIAFNWLSQICDCC